MYLFWIWTSGSGRDALFYLQLWWPSCVAEQNHLGNLCCRYYEEHFCVFCIWTSAWFRRRWRLKIFYLELWWPSCLAEDIWTILAQGIMRNISVKFVWIWISGSLGDIVLSYVLSKTLVWRIETLWAIWQRSLWGTFLWNYFEFRPAVPEIFFLKRFFLSRGLAVILFSGAEHSMQFWQRTLSGIFLWNYFEF